MKKIGNSLKIWQVLEPSPEIVEIQDLMPINQDDYDRLKADIQENGFRDPLKVYPKGTKHFIIGGFNRWKIAQELKYSQPLSVDVYQGTAQEYRDLAVQDNLNRRHFTAEEKRGLIKYFLKKDPEQSNKSIAKKIGTTKETVKTQREKLTTGGEIRPLASVKGQDGKNYKISEKSQKKDQGGDTVSPPPPPRDRPKTAEIIQKDDFRPPQASPEAPAEALNREHGPSDTAERVQFRVEYVSLTVIPKTESIRNTLWQVWQIIRHVPKQDKSRAVEEIKRFVDRI